MHLWFMWYIRSCDFDKEYQDGALRKHTGMSTNLCIHASINSLVFYNQKYLGTFIYIYLDLEKR